MTKKLTGWLWKGGALFLPLMAGAADLGNLPDPPRDADINNVGDTVCLVFDVVTVVFWIFVVIAILFIIVAAFRYLFSGGDPEKVKSANSALIVAVVAIVVAIIAWVIPRVVATFLGASFTDIC